MLTRFPAKIRSQLIDYGVLEQYTSLNQKNLNWDGPNGRNICLEDDTPSYDVTLTAPETKRRRMM